MSNSASNMPIRPGQMPAAGAGVRNAGPVWGLGMGMPPLGFGVVPQQPGNMMMGGQVQQMAPQVANWQQQQFMAAQQMGLSGATVGVQPMPQQQQHLQQQYQQHFQQKQYQQQQQWAEAQKKAAEEQKKMYEQIMKQRQFDEQKMRLQAFSSSKKMPVSADSMIENILGTKDAPKPKSPPAPPKKIGNEISEEKVANAKQGTAVDWSKMGDVDTLFVASQNNSVQSPASMPTGGFNGNTAPVTHMPSETTPGFQPEAPFMPAAANIQGMPAGAPLAGGPPSMPQQMASQGPPVAPSAAATPVMGVPCDPSSDQGGSGKTLTLPDWLSDKTALPAVYLQARSLVEGTEGWVDTSRAYMLLMKTGLPPPFLGVLWEMVNKTKPGHLRDQEFTALLALVALVQCGHTITSAEILSSTQEPVLPIIDHPALLPLVQDYVQQRQQQLLQQQQHQMQQQQQEGSQKQSNVTAPVGAQPNSANNVDDDEFDDFVGPPPAAVPSQVTPMNPPQGAGLPPMQASVALPTGAAGPPPVTNHKPLLPAVDKIKRMNLPELGSSPEQSPSVSFDHSHDDDFDDFQSATVMSTPLSSMTSVPAPQTLSTAPPVSSNFSSPPLLQPEKSGGSGDKYAVFRELEAPAQEDSMGSLHHQQPSNVEEPNFGDESFGDFCSSEPASLTTSVFPPIAPSGGSGGPATNNTTPVSFEVFSTPPEMIPETSTGTTADNHFEADFGVFASASMQPTDNYADIHEAMKRVEAEQKLKEASNWSDPFGEFEEAPSASTGKAMADFGSKQLQLNVCTAEEEDEDFGDFMGPDAGIGDVEGLSANHSFPRLTEALGETQSVASLELPGLEMTVGLQSSEFPGSGQSPDLFSQARNETCVEDQLRSLTLDSGIAQDMNSASSSNLTLGNALGNGATSPSAAANNVLDSFGSGLVDKYSIIREEASKNSYDEAHTGSWQRCLEGSIRLMEQARDILTNLSDPKLKSQVLATSQMQDYLANLQEVWFVCERITSSSQQVTTSTKVDELLTQAKSVWEDVKGSVDVSIPKMEGNEKDNQMSESEVCGVCLSGGGSKLTYGGHSYHPPCANLWLNCVDLLLPSLTPVTLL
ncbi:synergin gamma isoform X1 [Penaeus vannamei]|uniref:synergin gamma isoform X1 n=1 Tax=Penaeus vannamei TaxID=6689 RepID=UPI00387F408B